MIHFAAPHHAKAICAIYNYYVLNSVATFEEEPVTEEDMEQRIIETTESYPWLVWEVDGAILGYAYANRWKVRAAYRHTVEVSVYIDNACMGQGIGKQLYQALFAELGKMNIHSIIGGVADDNPASTALHTSFGFKKVAHFKETGYKFNRWIDVVYYQLVLQ